MSGKPISNTELVISTLFTGATIPLKGSPCRLNDKNELIIDENDQEIPVNIELNVFIALCEELKEYEVEAIRQRKNTHTTRKTTRSSV